MEFSIDLKFKIKRNTINDYAKIYVKAPLTLKLYMMIDCQENKELIMKKFLPLAARDGWSYSTLVGAAESLGFTTTSLQLIFENGYADFVEFYLDFHNLAMNRIIDSATDFSEQKIRDKIKIALLTRLRLEFSHRDSLRKLMVTNLDLATRPSSIKGLITWAYKVSDAIWKLVGDQSTDFNYYTKRATLVRILIRAIPLFVDENSCELPKTEDFIDKEIAKVMRFESSKRRFVSGKNKIIFSISKSIFDADGLLKSPKDLLRQLPFIRLIK
jgi:ubiquinone biosynthesis protein COQ9